MIKPINKAKETGEIYYEKCDHNKIIELAQKNKFLSFDIEFDTDIYDGLWTSDDFKIHGCSFSVINDEGLLLGNYFTDFEVIQEVIDKCFTLDINVIAHFCKFDIACLKRSGFQLPDFFLSRDSAVLTNICFEDRLQYGLKVLVPEFLGYELSSFDQASGHGMDSPEFLEYACEDSVSTLELYLYMLNIAEREDLVEFHDLISEDSIVFADMELAGIPWDMEVAEDLLMKLTILRDEIEGEIYSKIGRLNIGSAKQLRQRLFGELNISTQGLELTAAGEVSTGQKNIEKLAEKYPVVELILAFRTCNKMISSYLNPLTSHAFLNYDNRVHARFGFLQKTGRTSATNPGLQTIPSKLGSSIKFNEKLKEYFNDIKIRSGIKPPKGRALVVRDFSSIEYREAAVCGQDQQLIEMYRYWSCDSCGTEGSNSEVVRNCTKCGEKVNQGKDLHEYNKEIANSFPGVNKTRQECKELSFLSIFFGTAWKLGNSWGISTEVAQKILDAVFGRLKGLKLWHKTCQVIVRKGGVDRCGRKMKKGEIRDLFGRRRLLDLDAALRQVTKKARIEDWDAKTLERKLKGAAKNIDNMAINFGPQSSACTRGKAAMAKFRRIMIEKGWWKTRVDIILFVHDEIVVECDEEIAEEVNNLLTWAMETVFDTGVPAPTEGSIAYSETYTGPLKEGSLIGSYADCK